VKSYAVTSASANSGDQFSVAVDGQMIDVPGDRGIGIVVIDYHTRNVAYKHMYDTSQEKEESDKLVKLLDRTKDGCYIIMGVKGDGARKLTKEAKNAISNVLGSNEIRKLEYQDSWALIARKGDIKSIREARQPQAVTLQRTDDF